MMAVTPVRTFSPRMMVVWPTRTPSTSVVASSVPAGSVPMVTPRSRNRGRSSAWRAVAMRSTMANVRMPPSYRWPFAVDRWPRKAAVLHGQRSTANGQHFAVVRDMPTSRNPRQGKKPSKSTPQQKAPGVESKLRPPADHGETSYRGAGGLAGLAAIITGGDSGIGPAVAIAFAREGADVAICHLSPKEEADANETVRWI